MEIRHTFLDGAFACGGLSSFRASEKRNRKGRPLQIAREVSRGESRVPRKRAPPQFAHSLLIEIVSFAVLQTAVFLAVSPVEAG